MNLGENSGGCWLLGNARDMCDLAVPGSLGAHLKAADLKKKKKWLLGWKTIRWFHHSNNKMRSQFIHRVLEKAGSNRLSK